MEANPNNYFRSLYSEGVQRVKAFPFALITETSFAEYITGYNCDLTYIVDENNIFSHQYAMAVQKNSVYLDKFNTAIRQLKANGKIDRLRNRYWKKCGVLNGVVIVVSIDY